MSAPKVSLDPNPTFRKEVTIPGPGSQELKLDLEFRHRDTEELEEYSTSDRARERTNVQTVMEAVVNWHNCAEPFDEKSVTKLVRKWHRAPQVIAANYVLELTQARLGN